jgi:hypothetical protein
MKSTLDTINKHLLIQVYLSRRVVHRFNGENIIFISGDLNSSEEKSRGNQSGTLIHPTLYESID